MVHRMEIKSNCIDTRRRTTTNGHFIRPFATPPIRSTLTRNEPRPQTAPPYTTGGHDHSHCVGGAASLPSTPTHGTRLQPRMSLQGLRCPVTSASLTHRLHFICSFDTKSQSAGVHVDARTRVRALDRAGMYGRLFHRHALVFNMHWAPVARKQSPLPVSN